MLQADKGCFIVNPLIQMCKSAGLNTTGIYQGLSYRSLLAAHKEQGMTELIGKLRQILPDIQDQYTDPNYHNSFNSYWELKTRGLQAFQVGFVESCVRSLPPRPRTLVDIGDSSGNHILYLQTLLGAALKRVISVNLDPVAVAKAKSKGIDARLIRAEELRLDHPVDLYTSFQMVEHLFDPVRFMHSLAQEGNAEHLIFSVPLRSRSQVGLHELRRNYMDSPLTAEATHIFELSPEDWALLAQFSGWKLVRQQSYLQYPKNHPLFLTKGLWNQYDFPGFWAGFFVKDLSIAKRYQSW